MTLSLTINETLKRFSSLPILMQNCSGGDSAALGMVPPLPPHPGISDIVLNVHRNHKVY